MFPARGLSCRMTSLELAVASAVVGIGAVVQGSVGFGLNVIAAPILLLIDPALVPGPTLVIALALTVLIAYRERAAVDLRGLRWAFVGRIPGSIAGALAVAWLSERSLALVFAVMVLAAVVMSVGGWDLRPTGGTLLGAGAVSGLMGTVSSIGGPPMAIVYQRSPGAEIRANLSGYFIFGASLSLALLAGFGRFGMDELRASLVLLPGLFGGFALSRWTAPRMDAGHIRPAVLVLSAASAVGVIVRYLV